MIRLIKAAGKSSAKGAPLSNAGKSSAQGNNPSNESTSSLQTDLSYEEACDYAKELYGIELGDILTREEFKESADERLEMSRYTDVSGAGGKLKELAEELAGGDWDDYDKCRRIEAYLRQYSYDVRADGASGPKSDMRTSEGLADLADRFLFETGAGYCVHYTASMVMLLRLAGIPVRTSGGFLLSPRPRIGPPQTILGIKRLRMQGQTPLPLRVCMMSMVGMVRLVSLVSLPVKEHPYLLPRLPARTMMIPKQCQCIR